MKSNRLRLYEFEHIKPKLAQSVFDDLNDFVITTDCFFLIVPTPTTNDIFETSYLEEALSELSHKLDDAEYILIHLHGLHSCFQFTLDCPDEFNNRVSILKKGKVFSHFHDTDKIDQIKVLIFTKAL